MIGNLLFNDYGFPTIKNKNNSCDLEVFGSKQTIKESLQRWLNTNFKDQPIQLVSDCCHYDMVLFIDLFGSAWDFPKNICPVCHDINFDIQAWFWLNEQEYIDDLCAFNMSREKLLEWFNLSVDGTKHNSLYDSKVIKAIYERIE